MIQLHAPISSKPIRGVIHSPVLMIIKKHQKNAEIFITNEMIEQALYKLIHNIV
ncbi:MAG: hypothetical protein Q4B88_05115 [Moraxella sp.]|nr:hypothetical protein [Moraxella sp.]